MYIDCFLLITLKYIFREIQLVFYLGKKNLFCCMKDIFEFFILLPVTVLPMEVLDLYIAVKNELTVSKVVTGAKTHPENA